MEFLGSALSVLAQLSGVIALFVGVFVIMLAPVYLVVKLIKYFWEH